MGGGFLSMRLVISFTFYKYSSPIFLGLSSDFSTIISSPLTIFLNLWSSFFFNSSIIFISSSLFYSSTIGANSNSTFLLYICFFINCSCLNLFISTRGELSLLHF